MTKNIDEIQLETIELFAHSALNNVLHVWVVKRAIFHLTGRDPGWRGAYAVLAATQAVGYWADAGRQSRADLGGKMDKLKAKVERRKKEAGPGRRDGHNG